MSKQKQNYPQRLIIALILTLGLSRADAQTLDLPAVGVWNGFNSQLNVIECSNLAADEIALGIDVRDSAGGSLTSNTVLVPGYGTRHIVLNGLSSSLSDHYGIYILSVSGASSAPLSCLSAFYRMAAAGAPQAVEYAYAIPVRSPLSGESGGVYNSMNPQGSTRPILNWLSIYNPGAEPFSAAVEVYTQAGDIDTAHSFYVSALPPGDRRDYPLGHNVGQVVGIYRIIPDSSTQPYGAFVVRYSYQDSENRHNYAFPLLAQRGLCDTGPVSASTMDPAANWAEIANVSASSVTAALEVVNQDGRVVGNETITLAPFSQQHSYLNAYLGEGAVGRFRVRCTNADSSAERLIVESMFYGRLQANSPLVQWAYASQANYSGAAQQVRVASPVNTYLGAANWDKFLSADLSTPVSVHAGMYNLAGATVSGTTTYLPQNGSLDLAIHEYVGSDAAGVILTDLNMQNGLLNSELIRVFPHSSGKIGYIMYIPGTLINCSGGGAAACPELPAGVAGQLSVEGSGTNGASVQVFNAKTNELLGAANVSSGAWKLALRNPRAVPCRVWVESNGRIWIKDVESAPANCQ